MESEDNGLKPNLVIVDEMKAMRETIQAESKEDDNLDEHGRLKYEDHINFPLKQRDLIFMHETVRMVMDKGLVPMDEEGPVVTLLEMMASAEPDVYNHECMLLPVNYFVGLWHCLNTARKFSLYTQQWKKKDKWLDRITIKVAEKIDEYHLVKSHEFNEEKLDKSPEYYKDNVVKFPKKLELNT